MIHVFGKNNFGTACMRCGYFSHTAEAGTPCSGRYDAKIITDTEAHIAKLNQKLTMLRQAAQVEQPDLAERLDMSTYKYMPTQHVSQPLKKD